MPGGIPEAGLVAEATAAGQERGSWRPVEGAPQGEGAGAVSPGGSDAQDGRCPADPGGWPDAEGRLTMTEALVLIYMLVNAFASGFLACLLFGREV
jgi:hypothetical protein